MLQMPIKLKISNYDFIFIQGSVFTYSTLTKPYKNERDLVEWLTYFDVLRFRCKVAFSTVVRNPT